MTLRWAGAENIPRSVASCQKKGAFGLPFDFSMLLDLFKTKFLQAFVADLDRFERI